MNTVKLDTGPHRMIAIAATGSFDFSKLLYASISERWAENHPDDHLFDVHFDARQLWAAVEKQGDDFPHRRQLENAIRPAVAGMSPIAAHLSNLHLTPSSRNSLGFQMATLSSVLTSEGAGFAILQANVFTDESEFSERFVVRHATMVITDRPESVSRIFQPGCLVAQASESCSVIIDDVYPLPVGHTAIVSPIPAAFSS